MVDLLGTDVVTEILVGAAVARSIDAGLLLAHLHRLSGFRRLARLLQPDSIPQPNYRPPNNPCHLRCE